MSLPDDYLLAECEVEVMYTFTAKSYVKVIRVGIPYYEFECVDGKPRVLPQSSLFHISKIDGGFRVSYAEKVPTAGFQIVGNVVLRDGKLAKVKTANGTQMVINPNRVVIRQVHTEIKTQTKPPRPNTSKGKSTKRKSK